MRQASLTTAEIKAMARKVSQELPERLLRGDKPTHKRRYPKRNRATELEILAIAEQSYDQLAGKWRDWLEVARRFEHKAKAQDRLDLRHTIIVAFADQQARNERLGKPDLSFYGMLRIASHCVADYWREQKRQLTIFSLNTELEDIEGNTVELIDTLADDKAIDLDLWLDAKTFRLGCPDRLIQLATKRLQGISLNHRDEVYFRYQRQKELKRRQKLLTF